jgi:hypothetical protein
MVHIRFIGEAAGENFSDSERREVASRIEALYGKARCDTHGEALTLFVSLHRFSGEVWYGINWEACCFEFSHQIGLELAKEEREALDRERYNPPE